MTDNINRLADKVLAYYQEHRRTLPWRENPLPYHIWLSEIMLQQTRVDTVIPYFERFTLALPTIQRLAEASEDELLKLWEGLGYYSRVRNLQKSAKILVSKYNGELPSSKSELMKLPGIGAYTAGAIASIAFGQKESAVDGNLIRIGTRLTAYSGPLTNAEGKKAMESFWTSHLPEQSAGDFNQALMDIGATICLPNAQPLCLICPLREFCKAHAQGNPTDYPAKELKKKRKIERKTLFVLRKDSLVLLEKREARGLLAGLLQFPMTDGYLSEDEVLSYLQGRSLHPLRIKSGLRSKHIFSHIEWHIRSWEIQLDPFLVQEEDLLWIEAADLDRIALPTAFAPWRNQLLGL